MTRKYVITCDRCGKEGDQENMVPASGQHMPDYCKECYAENSVITNVCPRLSETMRDRWKRLGFSLTAEGVVNIDEINTHEKDGFPSYVVSTLTIEPLPSQVSNNETFYIQPYQFIAHDGVDKYGKDGYFIRREISGVVKTVGLLRLRKHKGNYRWEEAYAWDNDRPGELLWNNADADEITDIREAVQMIIYSLERGYDKWVNNLAKLS